MLCTTEHCSHSFQVSTAGEGGTPGESSSVRRKPRNPRRIAHHPPVEEPEEDSGDDYDDSDHDKDFEVDHLEESSDLGSVEGHKEEDAVENAEEEPMDLDDENGTEWLPRDADFRPQVRIPSICPDHLNFCMLNFDLGGGYRAQVLYILKALAFAVNLSVACVALFQSTCRHSCHGLGFRRELQL